MLKFLYRDQLHFYPTLRDTMFRDRTAAAKAGLGGEIQNPSQDAAQNRCDDLNPLYVILQRWDGSHGGSQWFLPAAALGFGMVEFTDLIAVRCSQNPVLWASTRLCLAPEANPMTAAAVMLGAAELMAHLGQRHIVGIFDARMARLYRSIGIHLKVIAWRAKGRRALCLGLWSVDLATTQKLARQSRLTLAQVTMWRERSIGEMSQPKAARVG